jgi:hypothetical protein
MITTDLNSGMWYYNKTLENINLILKIEEDCDFFKFLILDSKGRIITVFNRKTSTLNNWNVI